MMVSRFIAGAMFLALLSPAREIDERLLRSHASVYVRPAYPAASLQAGHSGRVVLEVVVGPNTPTSPLARVQSSNVVESPDTGMAKAVVEALDQARYVPFFDDESRAEKVTSRVVWLFRLNGGSGEVVDPYAPAAGPARTPQELAEEDLKIVRRARQLIGSEAMWNRKDNRQCPPKARTVSLYCAFELATLEVTGSFEHRGTAIEDARGAIDEVAPHHPDYGHLLMGYNNDPSTTFGDIEKVFDRTGKRISERATLNAR